MSKQNVFTGRPDKKLLSGTDYMELLASESTSRRAYKAMTSPLVTDCVANLDIEIQLLKTLLSYAEQKREILRAHGVISETGEVMPSIPVDGEALDPAYDFDNDKHTEF